MTSAPGIEFLAPDEKELFAQEFQKDVEFFHLLILMMGEVCATGSVDLTCVDAQQAGPEGFRPIIGTTQALNAPCARYVRRDRRNPSPTFCNIVSDCGRRAAESCMLCEKAAEQRVGRTGRAEVYTCHAGLTDIAVPVFCDGRHIATLYSGQVLTAPPSAGGFDEIRRRVRKLDYIDLRALEEAYWQVRTISREDALNTVRILEMFAEYLGRFWKRLGETVRAERRKIRENQLAAKEFAHLILQPEVQDRPRLRDLMEQIGLAQYPNRVLVVELETEEEYAVPSVSFDIAFTSALHALEELAERTPNMAVAYLRRRGVCVLFRDNTETAGPRARLLAEKMLSAISGRCDMRARVGIGSAKVDGRQLSESYHEACLALAGSAQIIAVCGEMSPQFSRLTDQVDAACRSMAEQRFEEARVILRALPILVNRQLGIQALSGQQNFLSAALESICLTALKAGCDTDGITRIRADAHAEIAKGTTGFEVQTAFMDAADLVMADMRHLLRSKHERLVERASQMVDRMLRQNRPANVISLAQVANALGVSAGHLSRMFRRVSGTTFREYAATRRVEVAKRLLLDPLNNIAAVSDRCGFSSPAYFARVFRKAAGCSPSEYANDPRRFGAGAVKTKSAPCGKAT